MIDPTPWTVRTVCGAAGGVSREATVTLTIHTRSDTVEAVRERVQNLPAMIALLERLHAECLVPDFAHDAAGSCPICRLLRSL